MTQITKYYHQASIAYLIYGVIYFTGALYLSQLGLSERGAMENSGWAWFLIGAIFVVGFPIIIWKGIQWFTLLIAAFMFYRIFALIMIALDSPQELVSLPWGGEMTRSAGALLFAVVAALAMGMLLRAGLRSAKKEIDEPLAL